LREEIPKLVEGRAHGGVLARYVYAEDTLPPLLLWPLKLAVVCFSEERPLYKTTQPPVLGAASGEAALSLREKLFA